MTLYTTRIIIYSICYIILYVKHIFLNCKNANFSYIIINFIHFADANEHTLPWKKLEADIIDKAELYFLIKLIYIYKIYIYM